MPGPPRKPTHLKILEGNPGHQKINKAEPKPSPVAPPCPAWLTTQAKHIWAGLAPKLESMGLLTTIDGEQFATYCQTIARWQQVEAAISAQETVTGEIDKGLVRISLGYLAQVRALGAEFGLTPSSRSRVTMPEKTAVVDEFEAMLR